MATLARRELLDAEAVNTAFGQGWRATPCITRRAVRLRKTSGLKEMTSRSLIGRSYVLPWMLVFPTITLAGQAFLIGGALFSDCSNPLGSGQADVTVSVTCDGGFSDSTTSFGGQGLWFIPNVPKDTCRVTVPRFCSVNSSCPTDPCSSTVSILVDVTHQAQNQSLAFWEGADLDDYAVFARCMTGPGLPYAAGCGVFDADLDADVDFTDAAYFLRGFAGP